MSKLIFEVDDLQLEEVNSILDSVGLDIEIAFSIFIRQIIKERGLPFSVKQNSSKAQNSRPSDETEVHTFPTRLRKTKNTITTKMIEEVWNSFMKYRDGYDDVKTLAEYIAEKSGMNPGSATIYLNILIKLSQGEINRRSMKPSDFKFFLRRFKNELGTDIYNKAIHSIEISIPYWKSNIPTFADSMINLLKEL